MSEPIEDTLTITQVDPIVEFENMKCAVYWIHQYCERTECNKCVLFGRNADFEFSPKFFECPFQVGMVPAEWALDGIQEVFLGYLDYLAEQEDEGMAEDIEAHTRAYQMELASEEPF